MLFDGISLSQGAAISNAVISSGASFPGSPESGELFFSTNSGTLGLHVYTSGQWMKVGSSAYDVYDISMGIIGTLSTGTQFVMIVPRICAIPAGAASSYASSLTAATASTVLTLSKKTAGVTTQVGTITFDAGSSTGTISIGSQVNLLAGDLLSISCDAADSTLADVGITLAAVI